MYEVELKFPLPNPGPVITRLLLLGARKQPVIAQRDLYFNHPSRDFAVTNEAFRIRTSGDDTAITYKGPLLDSQTKTRREIELDFTPAPHTAEQLTEMLTLLGFRFVRDVVKQRTPYLLDCDGRKFEVVLDEVATLGTYLEIETLADDTTRDASRNSLLALATRLGLSGAERRSYLSLLLEKPPT